MELLPVYRRLATPLHAARPAVGALWCGTLVTLALVFDHPAVLAALLAVVVAAGLLTGAGRAVRRAAALAVPFATTIALVNALVVREGLTVVARLGEVPVLGPLDVTSEGLIYGAVLGVRALVVVLGFVLLTAAVDPDGLLRALRRGSVRSGLGAALAARMVPVLARDGARLAEGQRCRWDAAAGGPRMGERLTVLRAVVTGALERGLELAATLELRGYATGRRPPRLRRAWSRHDAGFALSAVALAAAAIAAKVAGAADFTPYPATVAALGAAEAGLALAIVVCALLPFAARRGLT